LGALPSSNIALIHSGTHIFRHAAEKAVDRRPKSMRAQKRDRFRPNRHRILAYSPYTFPDHAQAFAVG